MSDDGCWRRIHACLDHARRERQLVILVEDGVVTLHTPPGEVASLRPQQLGQLRQDLADAQAKALEQRGRF